MNERYEVMNKPKIIGEREEAHDMQMTQTLNKSTKPAESKSTNVCLLFKYEAK